MRIDRMLGIVVILLNHNRITAKELSRRFEVSVRTIYRDIEAINMAGIPIISYSGSKGGLGIMENYRLSGQILSIDDMISIISTLKNVNTTLGSSGLENVSEKILSLIPKDKVDYVSRQSEELCIDLIPWFSPDKYIDQIKILREAISARYPAEFVYRNNKGESVRRIVEPMTLVFKGFGWYLFAYCRNKGDFRLFKLSRIKELHILPQRFSRKEGSYQAIMKEETNISNKELLTLKYSPHVRLQVEEYFEDYITEVLEDGSIIVNVTLPVDEWIYSSILSFGENVEVLHPPHIKEIIRDKIKKMNEVYNADIMVSQS